MTPEQIEQHRKKFEKISGFSKLALAKAKDGAYAITEVEHFFKGYLMFAENLEVELPEIQVCYDSKEDKVRHLDYEDVVSSLKHQGIKVKPCK